MRKRQRISTFYYFLLFFAQFFGFVEQQNSPLSRHFFVPARQQAAQQLRSRATNSPSSNGKQQFETITMPGGKQFLLVAPRRHFVHQGQKFTRQSKPHFGLSKPRNSHSPTQIHERNANNVNLRSRQLHLQQRRGAIVPHLRNLLLSSLPPKQLSISHKQLPQIQSTSQKRILLSQSKSSPIPTKLRIPPKANIPPKIVPELNGGNNASRIFEIKRRQEQFMKAQQRELKQINEKQIGMEKERQKLGKSRQKIVEKHGKSDELTKKERDRELLAIQRQQKVDEFSQEIMRQIFRGRTFSIATPSIPLQPQMVEITTPKTNEKLAIGNNGTTTNNKFQQNQDISSRLPPSPPSFAPMPPPTTIRSAVRSSSTPSATQIAIVTQTAESNGFPNPAQFSPLPPTPISTSTPPNGAISGGISPPAAAPPAQMPPNDNIVAELNNANNFMEVANQHRLPELFASRRLLATSALAALV